MAIEERIKHLNDFGRLLLPWAFAVLSFIFAAVSLFLLVLGHIPGAGLAAGIFFLCVLLGYFPQLESVKALSVDVKMRKSLDRADEILGQVKRLALVTSQHSLYSIAYAGRFGANPLVDKPELIDAILTQMSDLGLSKEERKEAVQPLSYIVSYDLAHRFEQAIMNALSSTPQAGTGPILLSRLNSRRKILDTRDANLHTVLSEMLSDTNEFTTEIQIDIRLLMERMVGLHGRLQNDLTYSRELAALLAGR